MVKCGLGRRSHKSHTEVDIGKFLCVESVHNQVIDASFFHCLDEITFLCRIILQCRRPRSVCAGCTPKLSGKDVILTASQRLSADLRYPAACLAAEINICSNLVVTGQIDLIIRKCFVPFLNIRDTSPELNLQIFCIIFHGSGRITNGRCLISKALQLIFRMESLRIGQFHLYRILTGIIRITKNFTVQSVNADFSNLTFSAVNETDIGDDIVITLLIHTAVYNHRIQSLRSCTSHCSRKRNGRLLLHHAVCHDHLRIISCGDIILDLELAFPIQQLIHNRQIPEIGIIHLSLIFVGIFISHG